MNTPTTTNTAVNLNTANTNIATATATAINNDGEKNADASISDIKVQKREHPLGKKVKVKIYSLNSADRKAAISVSINKWSFEIQQGKEVQIPIKVAKFLENDCKKTTYEPDEKGFSQHKLEPNYSVSYLQ